MNHPVPTTRQELLAVLDDIRAGIESGDTLEGFVQFELAYEQDTPDFMVLARYRVGNLHGQGGLRSLGSMEPTKWCDDCLRWHAPPVCERGVDGPRCPLGTERETP